MSALAVAGSHPKAVDSVAVIGKSENSAPFIGAWSLVSYELLRPSGVVEKPLGDRPLGRILYLENGQMSAQVIASALDPLATAKIEDLILELKKDYTIVIVTHNMQQAARISDNTAFFYLGELIEYGSTPRIFTSPAKKQTEDYVTGRFG